MPPLLTLAIPFALPPADCLSELTQPSALTTLKKIVKQASDCYLNQETTNLNASSLAAAVLAASPSTASTPPSPSPYLEPAQERWLAERLHLTQLPLAPLLLAGDGLIPGNEGWVVLQPVHLQATRDHLILTPPTQLELSAFEANALFEAVRPVLNELSTRLITAQTTRWYAGDENLGQLCSYSPLSAIGRNIDIWMPTGERARFWRQLQNEIQMIWHDHPVNQTRIDKGLLPVNSLWLFGQGKLTALNLTLTSLPQSSLQPAANHSAPQSASDSLERSPHSSAKLALPLPFDVVLSNDSLVRGIGKLAEKKVMPLPKKISSQNKNINYTWAQIGDTAVPHQNNISFADSQLLWLEQLSDSYLTRNWGLWLEIWKQIEQDYLQPSYDALRRGQIQQLKLVLFSDQSWLTISTETHDRWKIWRRRQLGSYLTAAASE